MSTHEQDENGWDLDFIYAPQLKQLLDMGFDEDRSRVMLIKRGGNVKRVLSELVE